MIDQFNTSIPSLGGAITHMALLHNNVSTALQVLTNK